MSNVVDLRSDTVTRPTPQMRRAIAGAEVGDDVFGEDPTVNRLEERAAELAGKEAALFVPSGTMANQLAIRSQTSPGDEVLLEEGTHPFNYESGAPAAISGVQVRPITGQQGVITTQQIAAHLRGTDEHYAPVTLVIMENTHNRAGGAIFPLGEMEPIRDLCRERGLSIHIDGARIFNAAVATGTPVEAYAACADTLSFCFSKGLGAPVGSVLTGTRELIARARRFRKMLGGGMRQAGILAAAALYALDHHIDRLAEDHARTRRLAEGIGRVPGFAVVNDPPDTNILIVEVSDDAAHANQIHTFAGGEGVKRTAPRVCAALANRGVLALPVSETRMRLVVHLDVDDNGIDRSVEAFRRLHGVR